MINAQYAQLSNLFIYSAMTALVVALVAYSVALGQAKSVAAEVTGGRRASNIGNSVTWLSLMLAAGGLVMRGLSAQRLPWGNMYEFALAAGFAILAIYCITGLRTDIRWLGPIVTLAVVVDYTLATAVLYTESAPLVPALQSYWLGIHVTLAIVSVGAFTVGAAFALLHLVADRSEQRVSSGGRASTLARRLPSAARLDLLSYRVHAFMFPLWTFAVITGAIWAEAAWGRFWGWDPKEVWSLITWVIYAAYLHARTTRGWKGRKASYLAITGFAAVVFNFFVVNLFVQGLHSYSGIK